MSASDGNARDPSVAPRHDSRSSGVRQYALGEVTVRIRGLDGAGGVRVHIEHKSGAALIVPLCQREAGAAGPRLETTGFDGTDYALEVDDAGGRCTVTASAPTAILGGARSLVLPRIADVPRRAPVTQLRITGDESTMPIPLAKPPLDEPR